MRYLMKQRNKFFEIPIPVAITKIASDIGATIHGNKSLMIEGLSSLKNLTSNRIASLHNKQYLKDLSLCTEGVCILDEEYLQYCPNGVTALVTNKPYRAFGKVATLLYPPVKSTGLVSPLASVHPSAQLGENCQIDAFVVIGENCIIGKHTLIKSHVSIDNNVTIGAHSTIHSHVSLSHCIIGDYALIKPGARIGQQGFGFHMDESGHFDVPQLGCVRIGNHVQIGANTTIDRGSQADTIISDGCRIDNLVQIGHNVEIGKNSVLVAQVGIAGSSTLGNFVIAAGQVGIAGHLNIGDGVKIAGQSGVMKDIPAGATIAGSPAVNALDWHRQTITLKKLTNTK